VKKETGYMIWHIFFFKLHKIKQYDSNRNKEKETDFATLHLIHNIAFWFLLRMLYMILDH